MSNTVFYIIAVVALISAVALMKYVVSCLSRAIILIVTVAALALVYKFLVDHPKVRDVVEHQVEKIEHHGKSHSR